MPDLLMGERQLVDEWLEDVPSWELVHETPPYTNRPVIVLHEYSIRDPVVDYALHKAEFRRFTTYRYRVHLTNVREQFGQFVRMWKQERGPISSASKMAMHPAYQRIIGMGPEAVPWILDELRREPDHWFWALRAITGANPVKASHRGHLPLMAQDWFEWAKEQGY